MALIPAAVVPVASAHYCITVNQLDPNCTTDCSGPGHIHIIILVGPPPVVGGCSSSEDLCDEEPTHRYGSGSSVGGRSATATGGNDTGVGLVTVTDSNVEDCNGDGIAGDWDGDYDVGVGGGAFGWGPWADEPICNNGLNVHGPNVVVNDVIPNYPITFVVGEDDQAGPVIVTDPETGATICETDGNISPGDPATDPTADPDDCLSQQYTTTGATCGSGGGDGLFWVFLDGGFVDENGAGTGVKNPPTTGTITAF